MLYKHCDCLPSEVAGKMKARLCNAPPPSVLMMNNRKPFSDVVKVYKEFVAAQGAGIGQQDRTKGTQQLWDFANSSQVTCACRILPVCFS